MRFTIGRIMVAVAVVAVLLALPHGWGLITLVTLGPVCLAVIAAQRLLTSGRRRIAAYCYGITAVSVNALVAALCVVPEFYRLTLFFLGRMLIAMPVIAAFGVAWAILATRDGMVPPHRPAAKWQMASVVALAVMPMATVLTLWPFRLSFLAARPTLRHLADQVAAGRPVRFPQWAGPFRIAGSIVDPATGNVGLMIDPNPNGPTGFVRRRTRAAPYDCYRPIRGDVLHVSLGAGWCYNEED